MLTHFNYWQRIAVFVALAFWASASILTLVLGHAHLFGALGSFALCISFMVFLTDKFMVQEARRHWDSQILTQSRMIWQYLCRIDDDTLHDPTAMPKLKDQITENFDDLLADKADEKTVETFHYELAFSVFGTLQWGFGELLIKLIKGA